MRCNSYIHMLSGSVSVLKAILGCGHPLFCPRLCHEVLNKSLVYDMMHWSDGQRVAATKPRQL